jgi:hypothetical protein
LWLHLSAQVWRLRTEQQVSGVRSSGLEHASFRHEQRKIGRVEDGDHHDPKDFRVKSIRKIDRPTVPEDRETDHDDERRRLDLPDVDRRQYPEQEARQVVTGGGGSDLGGRQGGRGTAQGLDHERNADDESKGVNAIRMRNFVRVIMTSNESWVVPAGMDERRFVVLDVNPRCAQNHTYFAEMDEQLNNGGRERLLHDLQAFDLTQVNLRHLPQTQALLEQKIRSLDTIDDFWFNRLHEGGEWPHRIGCEHLYAEYLKAIGTGRKRGPAEFGKRLAKLVPDLRKTRPTMEIAPGVMDRVWCYELPSLDECRAAFDDLLGQPVPWPALPPGEGERAQQSGGPDDVVPV